MLNLSKRADMMPASPIRKLVPFAQEAKKRGVKVYHLNIGQPDIKTPELFFQAIKNFDAPVLEYALSQGNLELIDSFREYYKKWNIDFAQDEIIITNGGSEAIIMSMMAIGDPGDEVLVPEPFYANYNGFACEAGMEIKPITTKAEEGFHLPSKAYIKSLIKPNTRAIMISNPGNPTGAVYTKEELVMLGEIALEHGIFLIGDEVYREFIYDGLKFTSLMDIAGIEDRVIICDSISKRYSACGARIGCVCSKNKTFMKTIMKFAQARLCAPTIEMIGATALVDTAKEYFAEVNLEYQKRRNIVYDALKNIPGVVCEKPMGAFYVVAKLPIDNAEDFAKWMLTDFNVNNATTMVAPAEGFYATPGLGKDEVRLAYILKEEDLKAAMGILAKGIEAYNKR
ncbi:pyridoxal phosphate-dependent aminotransferase [Lutispora thermophila]|uniref:Aminotransferase n=1 Tax=Lutispora saccharofermentans TaxID=3024236 RepID=A0ABT1NIS9_9FIRM|nr:pyridoxal phosphate-dependent aminotransferase [Lutispora saccharofermentans]